MYEFFHLAALGQYIFNILLLKQYLKQYIECYKYLSTYHFNFKSDIHSRSISTESLLEKYKCYCFPKVPGILYHYGFVVMSSVLLLMAEECESS